MAKRIKRDESGAASGEIAVRDPFALVRHLARSQPDPRKAVAELVQNALDEQATQIHIRREKAGGTTRLVIHDNGRGVLPELDRATALEGIAKNIGNSRKRQMSFDERMRAAMLGQFGIGLLGFWNIGHELRMISRVDNSDVWCLSLIEDSPKFDIFRVPDTGDFAAGTWTEIQVVRLHQAALPALVGAKLVHYLSVELRGQLIRHGTHVELEDRLARKTTDRKLSIKPAALIGDKLDIASVLPVAGFAYPAELSLFYIGDDADESMVLRLAAQGAVLLDSIAEMPVFDLPPWNNRMLGGIIDFPHLDVPPGSRRGVVSNNALAALTAALQTIAPQVAAALDAKQDLQSQAVSLGAQKQLSKWFTQAAQLMPHLDWFAIAKPKAGGAGASSDGTLIAPIAREPDDQPDEKSDNNSADNANSPQPGPPPSLFPPGPCATLTLSPRKTSLELGGQKRLRIVRRDHQGAATTDGEVELRSVGEITAVLTDPNWITVQAGTQLGHAEVTVQLRHNADVTATAELLLCLPGRRDDGSGIPTPVEVNEPQKNWRSRWVDDVWQINVGHPDALRLAKQPKARTQYFAYLLAKEVITRNFARPELGSILEEMVGLLAALDASK